jgi:hypothetical protein
MSTQNIRLVLYIVIIVFEQILDFLVSAMRLWIRFERRRIRALKRLWESTLTGWIPLLSGLMSIVIFLLVQYNNSKTHNHALVICLHQGDEVHASHDDTVRALQEAQKDHKDLASRFKSMNIGPKTVRGCTIGISFPGFPDLQGIVRGSLRIAPGRKAR